MESEQNILDECRKGNREAFRELYRRHSSVMLGVCARYSDNLADAEDILQEGFIKVFKKIGTFRGKGSFEGWMKRIMINTAINHYHSNLKHHYHLNIDDLYEDVPSDNEQISTETPIPKDVIMKHIQEMPEGYRFVFNMFVFEGFSHADIAKNLGISVNTSKTQLFKARLFLQKKLKPYLQQNEIRP